MQAIWDIIREAFSVAKEAGSYLLFYLLALGLGMIVAWDRYHNKNNEERTNWILEEAGKRIQLWPFLFSLLALGLVANPLCIWLLNKISPIQGQYEQSWALLLILFLIAHGTVCFYDMLAEHKQRTILVLGMVILTGLAGSSYGILSQRQSETFYAGEKAVAELVLELRQDENLLDGKAVLAADAVTEYLAAFYPEVLLLYGKDLYTPNLDLGIMDAYSEELLGIYEAMKNPEENLEHLAEMALLYDCGILVVEHFEKAPGKAGSFLLQEKTQDYLVYRITGR